MTKKHGDLISFTAGGLCACLLMVCSGLLLRLGSHNDDLDANTITSSVQSPDAKHLASVVEEVVGGAASTTSFLVTVDASNRKVDPRQSASQVCRLGSHESPKIYWESPTKLRVTYGLGGPIGVTVCQTAS
jgi:hypothetical protein